MEILNLYGSDRIKQAWLAPLLEGEIRSAFCMTEPDSASSDATNIAMRIERDGDDYVLNGRKWFSSGALADRCQVFIVMGKTDPKASAHLQQSMVVVPKDTPGISFGRIRTCSATWTPAATPRSSTRTSGCRSTTCWARRAAASPSPRPASAPAASTTACARSAWRSGRSNTWSRRALAAARSGPCVAQKGLIQDWIAESRIEIDMAREYVFRTAHLMDTVGNKAAATEISGIKVAVPNIALKIIDRAIQVHGAAGVTQFFPLAEMYAHMRTLRLADGPDEVHKMTIARREIRKYAPDFRMYASPSRTSGAPDEPRPFARP